MAEINKKEEVRLNIRVPQYLKDKVLEEADRVGMTQSELVRYIIMSYLSEKEK